MTETEKIKDAADSMYESQGYIDVGLISRIVNIPKLIVENAFLSLGYRKSEIKGQYYIRKDSK